MSFTEDYFVGSTVGASATFLDEQDVPTNTTNVDAYVRKPDGTIVVVAPVAHLATGLYAIEYLVDQAGRHDYRFVGTGTIDAASSGFFDVLPDPFETETGLITIRDVESYLGHALTGGQLSAASFIIDGVIDQLQWGYLGRPLEIGTYDESQLLYADENWVELNATPVRSITSVSIDNVVQPTLAYVQENSGVQLFQAFNVLGISPSTVRVVYTGGLGEPAQSVGRSVAMSRICRILDKLGNNELGLSRVSVEGYSARWLDEDDFTAGEKNQVQRWQRRNWSTPPATFGRLNPGGGYYNPFTGT